MDLHSTNHMTDDAVHPCMFVGEGETSRMTIFLQAEASLALQKKLRFRDGFAQETKDTRAIKFD